MTHPKKFTLFDTIKIPFKYTPIHATIIALERILWGFAPAISLLLFASLIDNSLAVIKGTAELSSVALPIIGYLGIKFFGDIMRQVAAFAEVRMQNKLRVTYGVELTEHQATLAYKHIENSESWDLISRVTTLSEKKITDAFYNILNMIEMVISVAGIMFVFATQLWWAALIMAIVSMPLLYIAIKGGKTTYDSERETSKNTRKAEYLSEIISNRDAAFERTLFNYSDAVNDRWLVEYETMRKKQVAANKKVAIRGDTVATLLRLMAIVIMFLLINPVLTGVISPGMFVSLINALDRSVRTISWASSVQLLALAKTKEYLNDLTDFYELENDKNYLNKPQNPPVTLNCIEFKNVSFTYPGTTRKILDGASFTIKSGKHYAFVGVNGAGKTTITKLLTGLYNEFEGEILLNGKSIKGYNIEEIKSLSAVVYQDFARYSISLKENILIGDTHNFGNDIGKEHLNYACDVFGLENVIKKLPQGIDTNLGKAREDGLDLSGGEWQRVALARAMVSPAPLIILDEPTAALDPISESKIYSEFEQISKLRTTIFISHRLGSTKLADQIIVISEGKIAEEGTHEELMLKNGLYKEMYVSQRSWYE